MKRVFCMMLMLILSIAPSGLSEENTSVFPQHEPFGKGIGAMPGRVVWTHDKSSVEWNGEGYWWLPEHFDEQAILDMVNTGIAALAGKPDAATGWESLFYAHNTARGRETGYQPGEKISIKVNMNGSGVFDDDTDTYMSYTNPVLLRALLLSLVQNLSIAPSDITVYDVSRVIPVYMMELCGTGELEGVRFQYRDILGKNDAAADLNHPILWSEDFDGEQNYLPTCVTEADYLINLANLKGHSYGITLCAKNHFGSLMNSSRLRPPEAANIHQFLTRNEMNTYSVLVDLMGNAQFGGKTVLYMLDALICATSEGSSMTGENTRWQQEPFNNDYTSSIFFSQDPIAIDSVGADFLMNEPAVTTRNGSLRNNPNVENYLHEAGLVDHAPSGIFYYDGYGNRLTNLGVHEHWNNATDKQYSRNLGGDEGVELIYIPAKGR